MSANTATRASRTAAGKCAVCLKRRARADHPTCRTCADRSLGLVLRDALELRGDVRRGSAWRSADEAERAKLIVPYSDLVAAAARLTLAVAAPDTESWHLATQVLE